MTNNYVHKILHGWGKTSPSLCALSRPEQIKHVANQLQTSPSIIARGNGKSYGDQAKNLNNTLTTERLNRLLAWDKDKGLLTTQGGVTLADILSFIIPKGWMLPALAGIADISVGGAIANDVHGKNHISKGTFGDNITELKLMLPSGEVKICSPNQDADIFWATIGGSGMTGIITQATMQLCPITSTKMQVKRTKTHNITDMLNAFENCEAEYQVGWINHFANGRRLGTGIFEQANVDDTPHLPEHYTVPAPRINVPAWCPRIVNAPLMRVYNQWKMFCRVNGRTAMHNVLFPLNGIGKWNNLYGKAGLLQMQCVLPQNEQIAEHMANVLALPHAQRLSSYLVVIKKHRKANGLMSFPVDGYSVAMDFPNNRETRALLHAMHDLVAQYGGRVYLAKDATLTQEQFHTMYQPQLNTWRTQLCTLDPENKMQSKMAIRLNFRGES